MPQQMTGFQWIIISILSLIVAACIATGSIVADIYTLLKKYLSR